MTNKIYSMSFARVYPCLINKALKKGRTTEEVNMIIQWLTGYDTPALEQAICAGISYEDFFKNAPELNPKRELIKGTVCGVRIENIEDPMMREIRYLDKLIDELAKGKSMDKIMRE